MNEFQVPHMCKCESLHKQQDSRSHGIGTHGNFTQNRLCSVLGSSLERSLPTRRLTRESSRYRRPAAPRRRRVRGGHRAADHQTRAGTHPDEPARMRWRHEDCWRRRPRVRDARGAARTGDRQARLAPRFGGHPRRQHGPDLPRRVERHPPRARRELRRRVQALERRGERAPRGKGSACRGHVPDGGRRGARVPRERPRRAERHGVAGA